MLVEWPQIPDTLLQLGRLTFEKGEYSDSIKYNNRYLEQVAQKGLQHPETLAFNPNKPVFMAHNLLAGSYYELGEYEESVEHYNAMLDIKKDQPDTYSNLAGSLFKLGKIDESIKYWKQALSLNPNWPEVFNNIAIAYYQQEKIEQAIEHWEKALALKPDWSEVRRKLELLAEKKKQQNDLAEYQKKLSSNPNEPNLYSLIGKIYYQQGDLDEAINYLSKAATLRPEDAKLHNILGMAFYQLEIHRKAAVHWQQTIQLDPNQVGVLNNLAWLLAATDDEQLKNSEKAIEYAQRACKLTDYNQPEILDTLGVAYAAAGKFDDATQTAEKAIGLAREAKQAELAASIEERLKLYKLKLPYP